MKNVFGKMFLITFNMFGVIYVFALLIANAKMWVNGGTDCPNMYQMLKILSENQLFDVRSVVGDINNFFSSIEDGYYSLAGTYIENSNATGIIALTNTILNAKTTINTIVANILSVCMILLKMVVVLSVLVAYGISSIYPLFIYIFG